MLLWQMLSTLPTVDKHWQVMHCATVAGHLGGRHGNRMRVKRRFVPSLDPFKRDGAVGVAE
jgi:hypothetical protein